MSAGAILLPEAKDFLNASIKEKKARTEKHEAKAERERAELKKVKPEVV